MGCQLRGGSDAVRTTETDDRGGRPRLPEIVGGALTRTGKKIGEGNRGGEFLHEKRGGGQARGGREGLNLRRDSLRSEMKSALKSRRYGTSASSGRVLKRGMYCSYMTMKGRGNGRGEKRKPGGAFFLRESSISVRERPTLSSSAGEAPRSKRVRRNLTHPIRIGLRSYPSQGAHGLTQTRSTSTSLEIQK